MDPQSDSAPQPQAVSADRSPSVLVVTPAGAGSRQGNRITALRWAAILRDHGCRAAVAEEYTEGEHDLLVALHADKSAGSVERFFDANPGRPIVVALTGTDMYPDCPVTESAGRTMATATRLIVTQPLAVDQLGADLRNKARVIVLSAPRLARRTPRADCFETLLLGNLRHVKDPLLPARAARRLPAASKVVVTHVGRALEAGLALSAREEERDNPRYRWIGARHHGQAMQILARSRLLVIASRFEGAPGALSEALAADTPVVVTAIPGCLGILGEDYPGAFEPGNVKALAGLLERVEGDEGFRGELTERCRRAAPLVEPEREWRAWGEMLNDLGLTA